MRTVGVFRSHSPWQFRKAIDEKKTGRGLWLQNIWSNLISNLNSRSPFWIFFVAISIDLIWLGLPFNIFNTNTHRFFRQSKSTESKGQKSNTRGAGEIHQVNRGSQGFCIGESYGPGWRWKPKRVVVSEVSLCSFLVGIYMIYIYIICKCICIMFLNRKLTCPQSGDSQKEHQRSAHTYAVQKKSFAHGTCSIFSDFPGDYLITWGGRSSALKAYNELLNGRPRDSKRSRSSKPNPKGHQQKPRRFRRFFHGFFPWGFLGLDRFGFADAS